MKVTLESTTQIIKHEGIDCRLWEGKTESGVDVFALIPRVAVHNDDDASEFEKDLLEQKPPTRKALEAFDYRYFID